MEKHYKEYDPAELKKLQQTQIGILKDFIAICEKYHFDYFMWGGSAIGVVRHQGFIPWDDDIDVVMPREHYNRFLEVVKEEMSDKYRVLTPLVDANYACNVPHFQKLGTKFVPYANKDLKCDLCIDIDVFPLDVVPADKEARTRQLKRTWVLNKLIFLIGTPRPIIPLNGIAKYIAKSLCYVAHYGLKLLHISAPRLYRMQIAEATRYNKHKTGVYTVPESTLPTRTYIRESELYPLVDMPFEDITVKMPHEYDTYLTRIYGDYMQMPPVEKRVNHAPYLLDFGDEQ